MRQGDGAGAPFHPWRSLFQEVLLLAPAGAGLTEPRRRIAQALLMRTNEEIYSRTGNMVSWLSVETLVKALHYDRRTVQRALRHLVEEEGMLEVARKGGGKGRSTWYRFSTQWLVDTADLIQNSGIAAAYGIPDDVFAHAYGGRFAAVVQEFGTNSGVSAAVSVVAGETSAAQSALIRGVDAALCADSECYSGVSTAVSGAEVETAAPSATDGAETAAAVTGNSGAAAPNSGAITPPETYKPIKPLKAGGRPTAATSPSDRRRTERRADPHQGHFRYVLPGGRNGEPPGKRSPAPPEKHALTVATARPLQDLRNPQALEHLVERATGLLGDPLAARRAVSGLTEEQKGHVLQGLRPTDDQLTKWLVWALQGDHRAVGGPEDGTFVSAVDTAAPQGATPETAAPEERLARVERIAEETATSVQTLSEAMQRLLTVLTPLLPAQIPSTQANPPVSAATRRKAGAA